MEKRKKVFKRISALCVAALVFFVAVCPALSPVANAMVVVPDENADGSFAIPLMSSWEIPLDVLKSDIYGVAVDNPMLSVATYYGANKPFYIDTFISEPSSVLGDESGNWGFFVSGLTSIKEDRHLATYFMQIDSTMNHNAFSFSASAPFVSTVSSIKDFLSSWSFVLNPGYTVKASVSFEYYFPQRDESGAYLLKYSRFRQSFDSLLISEDPTDICPLANFDVAQFPWEVIDPDNERMCYIVNFTVSFDFFNSLTDGLGDDGAVSTYACYQQFSLPVSYRGTGYTFEDFYRAYPGVVVDFGESVDSTGTFISSFLKNSVGAFLSTQIIPGISFGGILSTLIGIGLVFLFIKLFGG